MNRIHTNKYRRMEWTVCFEHTTKSFSFVRARISPILVVENASVWSDGAADENLFLDGIYVDAAALCASIFADHRNNSEFWKFEADCVFVKSTPERIGSRLIRGEWIRILILFLFHLQLDLRNDCVFDVFHIGFAGKEHMLKSWITESRVAMRF